MESKNAGRFPPLDVVHSADRTNFAGGGAPDLAATPRDAGVPMGEHTITKTSMTTWRNRLLHVGPLYADTPS